LIELSGVGKTYRSMRGGNYQALKDFDRFCRKFSGWICKIHEYILVYPANA
jgi:hypothetical protein